MSRLYVLLGIVWIIAWILLFSKTSILSVAMKGLLGEDYCQTCTGSSLLTILFPLCIFFIGGLGVSIGITDKTSSEGRKNYIVRVVAFAIAASIAGLPIYGWFYLSSHGV